MKRIKLLLVMLVIVAAVGSAFTHASKFNQSFRFIPGTTNPWVDITATYDPIKCAGVTATNCTQILVLQNGFTPPVPLPATPSALNTPGFVSFSGDGVPFKYVP